MKNTTPILHTIHFRGLLAAFAFFILLTTAQNISAATYTVDTTLNNAALTACTAAASDCSLRGAVANANASAAADTIVFSIPATDANCVAATGVCTITLTTGEIAVANNGSLTINGTGANRLTIDGGGVSRIFYSNAATFTLSGATLTNGNGAGASLNGKGGAIYSIGGTLVLRGVNVIGNTASAGGYGGGMVLDTGANHQIINSTFSGNNGLADCGGFWLGVTTLTMTNTTISGNTATQPNAGFCSNGTVTVRSSTIAGNTGGGFSMGGGSINISNSIVAGNTGSFANFAIFAGTLTSAGYNLIGDNSNATTQFPAGNPNGNNDIVGTSGTPINPLLDALANYGGTVPTRRLQSTSPAIDKGSLVAGVTMDARGVIRPYDDVSKANAAGGNGADIGAFELIASKITGWGRNSNGRIGDNTTTDRSLPTQIFGGFTDIVAIEGGYYHALGLRSNGTVLAWGYNALGQLGDGTVTQRNAPVTVSGLTNVVATDGGDSHSLALLSDGTIRAWGNNFNGQLGDGTTTDRTTPVAVSGITNAVAISAGNFSSYALLADGSVKAWGNNGNGQLGDSTTTQRLTPVTVSGLTSGVETIEAGGDSGYAIKSDGSLVAWGVNGNGQIGDGTTTQRTVPVQVSGLTSGVVQVAGGYQHAAALKADGTLLTWGDDSVGQLGDGTAGGGTPLVPTAISLANVVQIKTNIGYTTAARLRDGRIFAFGYNGEGQIGNGTTNTTGCTCQATPTAVSIDTGIGFFGIDGLTGRGGSTLATVAAGANQFVRLGDATVNFPNVATAGTVQIRTFDPSTTGLTVPSGYTISANSTGYDITTTAVFPSAATVCMKVVNVIDLTTFNRLFILHDDNFDGTFDIVSGSRDYQKREICRQTSSFSPFVLGLGPLAPTAASVTISGRVLTPNGRGLINAFVQLTDSNGETRTARTTSLGYYRFVEVEAGQTVIMNVRSKRYQFDSQTISVSEDLDGVNFMPIE